MESVRDKILKRVWRRGRGYAFSSKDFLSVGTRASVDKALSNLVREEKIRRVARGLYDYPRVSELLGGELSPDADQVAQAVARKHGQTIVASGAWAANVLGLTTQVPARIVYLTEGPPRELRVGKQEIEFRRVVPTSLRGAGNTLSSLVVQALRHLGRDRVDESVLNRLRTKLTDTDRRRLLADARYAPDWVYAVVKQIAEHIYGTVTVGV